MEKLRELALCLGFDVAHAPHEWWSGKISFRVRSVEGGRAEVGPGTAVMRTLDGPNPSYRPLRETYT